MKDRKVAVNTKNSYNIIISNKQKKMIELFKKLDGVKTIFIVTDDNVAPLYLDELKGTLSAAGFNVLEAVIRAGEGSKNLRTLGKLYDIAVKKGIDRKACIVAFGGGVVGDIAGFFASTFMRGLKFVQVPTTLLAMADSSVGGKTGVNTDFAKNIAGTFYQPCFVFVNTDYLKTLPERQIKNGLSEITKYAFSLDRHFLSWLTRNFKKKDISKIDFEYAVYKACSFKSKIVAKDEYDKKGIREVLNFGHTLAHALETYFNYKKYLHGEAVAKGMVFAGMLSDIIYKRKDLQKTIVQTLKYIYSDIDEPLKINAKKTLDIMRTDKKNFNAKIRFVLLENIGKYKTGCAVDEKIIMECLSEFSLRGAK
jgi:3-dehydroquinate synthase